ncbi:MAG: hypothetical protein HN879_10175 [Flavobacteriaceae bacterium]|nr:hypothetical protein [Flavobacteriaceae bacterium]
MSPESPVEVTDGIEVHTRKDFGDDFQLKKSCHTCIHNKVCAPFLSMVETKKNFDTQFKMLGVEMPIQPEMLAVTCINHLKPQAEGFLK